MNFIEKISEKYFIVLPLIIFVLYLKLMTFNLVGFGDSIIIVDNYERISDFSNLVGEFSSTYPGTTDYKPLTMFSFYINAAFSGSNIYSYHVLNLILLSLTGIYIFKVSDKIFMNRSLSFLFSIIFLIHPLLAGANSLITSRSNILMLLFGVIALFNTVYYSDIKETRYLWQSGLYLLASMMSDFSGFAFLIIILVYHLLYNYRYLKENFNIIFAPILSVLIIWFLFFLNIEHDEGIHVSSLGNGSIQIAGLYINLDAFKSVLNIIGAFLIPIPTYLSTLPVNNPVFMYIGIAILLGLTTAYFVLNNNENFDKRIFWLGVGIIISGVLASVFGLTETQSNIYDYPIDSAYLPILGLLLIIASIMIGFNLSMTTKLSGIVVVILMTVLSFLSFFQLGNYATEIVFYESAHEKQSDNTDLTTKLIGIYIQGAYHEKLENINHKIDFSKSENSESGLSLSEYYYSMKEFDKAIKLLEQIRKHDNNNRKILNLLVNSYYSQNDYDKACEVLSGIASDTSKFPEARWDLFNMYLESKNFEKAIEFGKNSFKDEEEIKRALIIVENRSKIFFKENDNVSVVKSMKTGLELDPDNPYILNYLYDTYIKIGKVDRAKEYERRLRKIFDEQIDGKQ